MDCNHVNVVILRGNSLQPAPAIRDFTDSRTAGQNIQARCNGSATTAARAGGRPRLHTARERQLGRICGVPLRHVNGVMRLPSRSAHLSGGAPPTMTRHPANTCADSAAPTHTCMQVGSVLGIPIFQDQAFTWSDQDQACRREGTGTRPAPRATETGRADKIPPWPAERVETREDLEGGATVFGPEHLLLIQQVFSSAGMR